MPGYVIRLKYEPTYRWSEDDQKSYVDRPGGWGYMSEDGGCFPEDRHGKRRAHVFASEADAWCYLAAQDRFLELCTEGEDFRIEALDTDI